ncbi:MAG: sulfate ABC transporter permease [Bacteroidetes bacterium]|nr:sulfate ABC transporter permease [Bacteroidota bacterium]
MHFEKKVREFFEIDKRLYFVFLCLITFLVLLIKKNFVENETAAFEVLESRGQMGVLNLINAFQYLTIPFFYLWKFTLTGFILWLGSFAFGYKISFRKCWQIAMIAETLFLIPEMLKIIYFMYVFTDPNLFEIRAFYPFSLMNLVDYEEVASKWHYPLKALNIFEIIYWAILMYGIHFAVKKKREVAVLIVLFSYVPVFLLWLWFYVSVYK